MWQSNRTLISQGAEHTNTSTISWKRKRPQVMLKVCPVSLKIWHWFHFFQHHLTTFTFIFWPQKALQEDPLGWALVNLNSLMHWELSCGGKLGFIFWVSFLIIILLNCFLQKNSTTFTQLCFYRGDLLREAMYSDRQHGCHQNWNHLGPEKMFSQQFDKKFTLNSNR